MESTLNWFQKMWKDKEANFMIIGLDASGKTTILCKF